MMKEPKDHKKWTPRLSVMREGGVRGVDCFNS